MIWKYQEGKITWQEYLVFLKTVEEQWKKPISLPQPTTQPEKYTK